jgi:Hint domain
MTTVVFTNLDALTNNFGGNFTVNSTGDGVPPFTVTFTGAITLGSTFTYTDGDHANFTGNVYDGSDIFGDIIFNHGGSFHVLTDQPFGIGQHLMNNGANFVCFAAGTLIRTPRGDVLVETLKVGDLVVTASGELRPVKWIGHRGFDLRSYPDPRPAFPVRIAADALGPGRPSQDLYVSSGHSICIDLCGEVLIPAGLLVNGATIVEVEVEEISYWHVELDSHDILIANNLPAESYLAMANRGFFEELRGLLPAYEEGRERTYADFCRPVVLDGPALDFVRQRLLSRAEAIGWTRSFEADLHLVVDGEVRRPLIEGDAAVFLFPASAREVRLKSNTFIPALVGGGDPRPLGVPLTGLVFLGGRAEVRSVRLDDERLQDGLHPEEGRDGLAWRWTKGELALSPDFWQGLSGHVALHLTCNANATRWWVAPERTNEVINSNRSKPKLYAVGPGVA